MVSTFGFCPHWLCLSFFNTLAIWVFGHGSSLEMGIGAVIFAILMAILLPVLPKADANRRYKQQKAVLNQKRNHAAPLLKNAPKPAPNPGT